MSTSLNLSNSGSLMSKTDYMRGWRERNRSHLLGYYRRYNSLHREQRHEYMRKYKRRPDVKARDKLRRDLNPEPQRERYKQYYQLKSEEIKARARERNRLLKVTVIGKYSPSLSCSRCGFSDMRALSIDHINGGGTRHHAIVGHGTVFYQWLQKNNCPEGFQVLCMNCQWIKRQERNENANVNGGGEKK